jgi:membrane-bound lytic murein transglycosylase D
MAAAIDLRDSDQTDPPGQSSPRASWIRALVLLALLVLLAGCQSTAVRPSAEPAVEPAVADTEDDEQGPPATVVEPPAPPVDLSIWPALRSGFALPPQTHPRIDREVKRLTRSPVALQALLLRSEPYLHHVLAAVRDAGLPTEIALLPAVESGFRTHAYSPNGAAGLWQFMPATGQMLGLDRDWWVDNRRDVRASTQAAIVYLQRLHERFDGDWLHALAAYNAGTGTVSRAIRRARSRNAPTDFWSLDLPGETDAYVPRLLALTRVVRDPQAYDVSLPEIDDTPYFVAVDTGGQIDLGVAAKLAGVPAEDLLRLNPAYRRWATHPDGPYSLLVPVDTGPAFEQALASLPDDQRLRWQRHRIARGDSLIKIARQYDVSVAAIKQTNQLKDSRIRAGRDLLIPLSDNLDAGLMLASNNKARQRVRYEVRRGDSLWKISRRFQVSVADLRRWNQVGRYLRPGERLTVFIDPDA